MGVSAAIAGLGITEMGKVYGRTASDFAGEAIALALEDAGLQARDLDGLLINGNQSEEMAPRLQFALGLVDLTLVNTMSAFGSTAGTMLQYAAHAIETGQANVVACVYADAPLREGTSVSQSGYSGRRFDAPGLAGLRFAYGDYGPANSSYALALRRHMHLFGTTHDQLGTIAVGQREWALMNPQAQMRRPMTLEDYHASRWIVEPLHLFDCCLVSNGGVAVIVTSAQRARELRQPPVYMRGFGQCAPGDTGRVEREPAIHTGAAKAGEIALRQAGIELVRRGRARAVRLLHVHRPRDARGLRLLREGRGWGVCRRREARPGGSLPCNTGGGQLSSYYMWGFTPLAEGVIQARGHGGERQVDKHDHVLVSGNGGTLNFHSTTILSQHDS